MFWVKIIIATILPVLLSVLFYLLNKKTGFGKLKTLTQQIIIGIVFGILACLDTQYGIPANGYVLNVRSAAPLTAGLVFGGPAGLIAGIMGALYRWFSVYWGIPAYTRVACSVATLLAGVISTLCHRYMFSRKKTSCVIGMFIAAATEVLHMLLVFITHWDDIGRAFVVVQNTAVTMIIANSISVLLSLLFVELVSKEGRKRLARPMTQTFTIYLFSFIIVSFFAASSFTYYLQNNVAEVEVKNLLTKNIQDVESDIADALDRDLLDRTKRIKESLKSSPLLSETTDAEALREYMIELADDEKVSEINIVGKDGKIVISTNTAFDGFDMTGDPDGQAIEFMCLLDGTNTYIQEYGPMDYDNSVYRKYAGVNLSKDYFIQVGYDKLDFQTSMLELLKYTASNRHIGQTGFIYILDPASVNHLVSAPPDTVTNKSVRTVTGTIAAMENGAVYDYTDTDGTPYYFMKDEVEGYIVCGCIPVSEAIFSRDTSVYIGAFMEFIIFFVLFVLVFILLKKIIVDNIHKINSSLEKITNGNLNTRIDVHSNEEFISLSNDINTTVERLKEYIAEAEQRIDKELAFAKSIQHSALPSVFPAYPNRNEFDLYACMETAKEVGGDFYDFYLIDHNHLAFLIADVSGKGIPAAMFMMTAKTMIKSYAENGQSVSEVFTLTNEKLYETNEAGMFVTAWMGILDLKTGIVHFANAGHNPPCIRRKNGTYEYLKSRPGLVLAGMDGINYRENEIQLQPGDELFLYTDGVTEATDSNNKLYGEDRLLITLSKNADKDPENLCKAVHESVNEFVGEAPQFDDITMLSLKFKTFSQMEDKKE